MTLTNKAHLDESFHGCACELIEGRVEVKIEVKIEFEGK
jgi:hypothetical protein